MPNFDIQEYLFSRRAAVDAALERYIREQPGHSHALWRAMRYGLFPDGKRIRPMLTLAAGKLFGGKQKQLLPLAYAIAAEPLTAIGARALYGNENPKVQEMQI